MPDFKKKRSYNVPGHAHELTFSTYRRLDVLTDERTCRHFLQCLDLARKRHGFHVWAYVLMPNHVHLLVWPTLETYSISSFLRFKVSVAIQALFRIGSEIPGLAAQLTVPSGDGPGPKRFWQRSGGYDRNLFSPQAVWKSIEYIHANPVRRGLVEDAPDWPWSSARAYSGQSGDAFEVDLCPVRRDEAWPGRGC